MAILIAGASCGDDLPPPPGLVQSGARLAVAWHVLDDGGARVPAGLVDRALAAPCAPEPWSDGATYCTPADTTGTEVVFLDDACAGPVGQLLAGDDGVPPVPRYFVRHYEVGPAGARERRPSRLYRAGTALLDEPTQVWVLDAGVCAGPRSPGVSGLPATYHALAEELTPARVVARTELVTAALALDVLTGDDGLHLPVGWRDRALDVPCALDRDGAPGAAQCVPTEAPAASYFHDDACAEPVLAVERSGATPPFARYRDPATGCTATRALGEETPAPPLFLQARGACEAVTAPTTERFHLLGAPLDLPAVTRTPAARTGRVVPLTITAGDEAPVLDDALLDTTLGTPCRIEPTGAATGVCAPITDVRIVTYFADDACQVLVDLAAVPAPSCGPAPAYARAAADLPPAFHAIGAIAPGPIFHKTTGERCEVFGGLPGVTLHAVGPALTTELATSTVVVDPASR